MRCVPGTAWGACEGTEFLDLLLGEDPWKRTENRWRFGMICFGGRFDGKILELPGGVSIAMFDFRQVHHQIHWKSRETKCDPV